MNLSELRIQASNSAKIPNGRKPFRWMTHHISQIYTCLLPKVDINGSTLITLEFGPKNEFDVESDNVLGCTNIFIENFDFEEFYILSAQEQGMILAEEIKRNLIQIHNRHRNNAEVINAIVSTANKMIEIGFDLDVQIKKLGKSTKDRKNRIEVYRVLNAEVGESWNCVVTDKKASCIKNEIWMTDVPGYLDRTDYFKRAEMNIDTYTVYDNLGRKTFQVRLE